MTLLETFGYSLVSVLQSAPSIYFIYFFSFFFLIFILIYQALTRFNNKYFKPKQSKAISLILSFMISGSVFYNRSAYNIVDRFNSITGFIFLLIISITFIGSGIFLFKKYKEQNKNLAYLIFAVLNYLGTNLLIPHFQYGKGGYIIFGQVGANIITTLLSLYSVSLIIFIFYTIIMLISGENKISKEETIKEEKKEKNIHKYRTLLKKINNELLEINELFGEKLEILETLQKEIIKNKK